ncbi:Putative exodeoxyribonuclease 8, PDDEXK-like domain containing protein [uncultured Caudovirales phage]|uniref:Exodeoxyribonuclease 8, PDDEXK-like domain containing protein n=1 Tax=uncultured Caudovirales phage TaxID=2100421 RepID=A0A6J5PGR2_9CAUD|nr:Putative exodeoxyribonuclease 8, PDDEXK-like domain containing protein [uncultured Caudovirales phage]CAB4170237.1 Putative exodeoxyribonuclease 8, PDDEXK-like domain containing protein [uncultured Caudovirales phage]CAB4177417.1 Putative exodeoxyribonuclease 8, PDDEXK-like domain containing protein [uncultured Caudovirales phage]CAB4182944.1 Putative exodeoxyribonuclease 8, PDDEXK-like domain containing protein [uncultured Caudovirales phage]CAB4186435.1 Putative exodeoxyribonuclease 8, PDD
MNTITTKYQGLYENMSGSLYHSLKKYLNSTAIKTMSKTTKRNAVFQREQPEVYNAAFGTGKAVHCLILTPHEYEKEICLEPDCDRRTKGGKEIYAKFMEWKDPNMTAISEEQENVVFGIHESLQKQKNIYSKIVEAQYKEVSLFQAETPQWMKVRFDVLDVKSGLAIDIKTMREPCSAQNFQKASNQYGYILQSAYYSYVARSLGIEVRDFAFVCCEVNAPYECAAYIVDPELIKLYEAQIPQLLEAWGNGEDTTWPDTFQVLSTPKYEMQRAEDAVIF